MTRRCMRLLVTLVLAVAPLLEALQSPRSALAQVSAGEWFFEIDGDYGSVLGPESIPSSLYTIPSRNITDGEGSAPPSTYAPRQGYAFSGICGCENSGLGNVCVVHYDACGAGFTPTCNPKKGANGGGCGGCACPRPGLAACTNWWHEPSAPYMGEMSYRVECRYPGGQSLDPPQGESRRSEQMLLHDWYTGDDSARYFTLAFKFAIHQNAVPLVPGGYITQWHQGGSGAPPVRLSWVYENGAYYLEAGINHGPVSDPTFHYLFNKEDGIHIPAAPGVWHRMVFRVDPGPEWDVPGCERCPTSAGSVHAWMMNARTGAWKLVGDYFGQVGYCYASEKVCRSGKALEYQWKVGQYANEVDYVILDYDNVAYGKRWNIITKNRLTGYHKSVLNLSFDEGQGATVHDRCWAWNGGQQGDPVMGYDNDGQIQGNVTWSTDGVGSSGHSLRFNGGYVNVPMDTTDFDFGNYVTVSAWFKTTERHADHRGLGSIDEDALGGKLFLAKSDDKLSFGVQHPDGTYSGVICAHAPGLYADGQWHHVVGTFNRFTDDNRRVKLYVDGERMLQRVGSDLPILRGDNRLMVGKFATSGYFVGNIDEVNVLNYVLTDEDVASLYVNLGRPDSR
jgi:Concanavalin A-like lectin/glucanases superfamily/Polysaccharide lyase